MLANWTSPCSLYTEALPTAVRHRQVRVHLLILTRRSEFDRLSGHESLRHERQAIDCKYTPPTAYSISKVPLVFLQDILLEKGRTSGIAGKLASSNSTSSSKEWALVLS